MGDMVDDTYINWFEEIPNFDDYDDSCNILYIWMDITGNIHDMHDMSTDYISDCIQFCIKHKMTKKLKELEKVLEERCLP